MQPADWIYLCLTFAISLERWSGLQQMICPRKFWLLMKLFSPTLSKVSARCLMCHWVLLAPLTGLKNGWLAKSYYVKSVIELLLSMRFVFHAWKIPYYRRAVVVYMHGNCNINSLSTDDRSYLNLVVFKSEMLFESIVDSSGFQRSHFGRRTLQNQTVSAGGVCKDIDWSRCLIPNSSSVNTISWTRHSEGRWSHGSRSVIYIYWCTIS